MKKELFLFSTLLTAVITLQAATVSFNEMPPAQKRVMPSGPNQIFSFNKAIDKAKNSVVYIATKQNDSRESLGMSPHPRGDDGDSRGMSLGSGVIVTPDGYIVTNSHVIANASSIMVKIPGSDKEYDAKLIGSDPKSDIAVIKIDAKHLDAINMGRSSNLKIGDVVFAIGNPFGVGLTVTQGIISAQHKNGIGINEYENFIQTDASINPGNSGGALIDSRGALIGINSAIITSSGGNNGIGFAIEVDMVKDIAQKLIESGSVARGFLGVSIADINSDLQKIYKHQDGALILNIEQDSPAAAAGLKRGDLIFNVDGQNVKNAAGLKNAIGGYKPDTHVKISFERDGKDHTVTVTLANLDGMAQQNADNMIKGLSLENLGDKYRYRLRIPNNVDGVLITGVDSRSEAADQGIRPGDLIVQVEDESVTTLAQLSRALKKAKGKLKRIYLYRQGSIGVVTLK